MDTVMDTDMDTMVIMERGKLMLRLLQDISMATLMDMVIMDMVTMDMEDMDIMDTMERGKLKLPQDIIMVTMDMEVTDTHMVTMAMDTMVKQQLFFYSNIDWNLSESSQQKHTPP